MLFFSRTSSQTLFLYILELSVIWGRDKKVGAEGLFFAFVFGFFFSLSEGTVTDTFPTDSPPSILIQ